MAHKTIAAVRKPEVLHRLEKCLSLQLGPRSQDICQWIVNVTWLARRENVAILVHGVSLSWRASGRLRHPPRYAAYLTPSSPIFSHSSRALGLGLIVQIVNCCCAAIKVRTSHPDCRATRCQTWQTIHRLDGPVSAQIGSKTMSLRLSALRVPGVCFSGRERSAQTAVSRLSRSKVTGLIRCSFGRSYWIDHTPEKGPFLRTCGIFDLCVGCRLHQNGGENSAHECFHCIISM